MGAEAIEALDQALRVHVEPTRVLVVSPSAYPKVAGLQDQLIILPEDPTVESLRELTVELLRRRDAQGALAVTTYAADGTLAIARLTGNLRLFDIPVTPGPLTDLEAVVQEMLGRLGVPAHVAAPAVRQLLQSLHLETTA